MKNVRLITRSGFALLFFNMWVVAIGFHSNDMLAWMPEVAAAFKTQEMS